MVRTSSSVRPSDPVEAHLGAAAEIATLIRSVPLLQVATPASSSPPLVLMFYVFMFRLHELFAAHTGADLEFD